MLVGSALPRAQARRGINSVKRGVSDHHGERETSVLRSPFLLFCGRCGTPVTDSTTERAVVCPACGLVEYPKICPAVIAAVTDGDRLVLTKYRGRAFRKYALVAGFNEIGESIEDTVRREVLEETGLRVKDITFYKSQPWVVTDTLLMGFFCKLDGPDTIHMQEDELSVAQWFYRSQIPDDYSAISLTGEMIEVFRRGAVF